MDEHAVSSLLISTIQGAGKKTKKLFIALQMCVNCGNVIAYIPISKWTILTFAQKSGSARYEYVAIVVKFLYWRELFFVHD